MSKKTILVNLNRCTGCWTCSMACKVAHDLPEDTWWQYIRTVGEDKIDEPAGEWPNLTLSWLPIFTQSCIMCPDRTKDGLDPYCVYNCPTKALTYGDLDEPDNPVEEKEAYLKEKGFREYVIPEWEDTRDGIKYMTK